MRNYNFILTLLFMFFGLSVWLFPQSLDSVKFLGFSKPLWLKKSVTTTQIISSKRNPSNLE